MNVKLLTYWREKELCCVCTIQNKCRRNGLQCEELDFILNDTVNVKELMDHDSYKRVNGRIQQRR